MKRAYLLAADSGGIQEEAPGLGKPVLVLREITERPEAVDAGSVKIAGTYSSKINEPISWLITNEDTYRRMVKIPSPDGDGTAVQQIIDALTRFS